MSMPADQSIGVAVATNGGQDPKHSMQSKTALPGPQRGYRRQRLLVVAIPTILVATIFILSRREPSSYVERLNAMSPESRKQLSREFLNKSTRLINDIQHESGWKEQFTEDEINAWLAEDFRFNHAEQSLPRGVSEPRIVMAADHMQLNFRFKRSIIDTVIQIAFRAWVPKQNLLAVELQTTWAGALPLPTNHTRHVVEQIAHANDVEVTWKRNGRNLVALLDFARSYREIVLEQLQIHNGRLEVQGLSGRPGPENIGQDYAPAAN